MWLFVRGRLSRVNADFTKNTHYLAKSAIARAPALAQTSPMPQQVVMGAMLQCSFGAAPCSLIVLPTNRVNAPTPAATIADSIALTNIPTFGMCSSLANPTVATATTAASGVLTPMPCVPATGTPWTVGAITVLIGSIPALDNISTCMCSYAGVVAITSPGQGQMQIP